MGRSDTSKIEMLRYIYFLDVNNRGIKSRYFGLKKMIYVGQTNNLERRLNEHLLRINSKFLVSNFPNSIKKLVFVRYIYGTEDDSVELESFYKNKRSLQKKKLIISDENQLVRYIPNKAIILKKYNKEDEQFLISLKKKWD